MISLAGQVGIVTGAGSGIGREIARALAADGMTVVCTGRRAAALEETVAQIAAEGGAAQACVADVTEFAQAQRMAQMTLTEMGKIDLLVNNAGSFQSVSPLWEADPDAWEHDVRVNLLGTFHACRAVLPAMRARNAGAIVHLDGGGGARGANPGGSAYAASKAGLARLTETVARELERDGSAILVFGINPGFVRTEMTEGLANSPWQPHVRSNFDAGRDRAPDWCGKTLVALLHHTDPAWSGRTFDQNIDVERVIAAREQVIGEDLYRMKTRALPEP